VNPTNVSKILRSRKSAVGPFATSIAYLAAKGLPTEPVNSLKDISVIDSVHLLQRVRAFTDFGSVTSEGDAFSSVYCPTRTTVWVGYRESFRRETCPVE
jgi:hypothetical protein